MSNRTFTFKTLKGSSEALEFLRFEETNAIRRGKKISINKTAWREMDPAERVAVADELHQFGGSN